MATEQCTVLIDRPADDILEFILDVRAYRDVDPRLGSIRWVRRMPGSTVFRFRPQLMGLPAPLSTQLVVRRGMKVDITALPSPSDRLADFAGLLACVAGLQGITVTRSLRFDLAAPLAPILDRRLQRWAPARRPGGDGSPQSSSRRAALAVTMRHATGRTPSRCRPNWPRPPSAGRLGRW